MTGWPVGVLVFSGKRKSGKDFIASLLQNRLGDENCAVLRLSAPLKKLYAEEHGLDFGKLLDSSGYKEKYRADMIKWGEKKRTEDSEFFCCKATCGGDANKPVWIITDARRHTDVKYFKEHFPEKVWLVRIQCEDSVREERGYIFTEGIDDAESECGLDSGVDWNIVIQNNGNQAALEEKLDIVVKDISRLINNGDTMHGKCDGPVT